MAASGSILKEGPPESVGMDPVRIAGLRKLAESWVENGDTPSLVLLVARRGTVVLHQAFGVRRPEDTGPTLKPDSIFPIASCSKSITAAVVMCLVEDGLIGLNRPFVDYVPELDVAGVQWLDEATVGDLLCHTSCIDDLQWTEFLNEAAQRSSDLPPAAPGQHPALNRRIRLVAADPPVRRQNSVRL